MTNKVNGVESRPVAVGGSASVARPRDVDSDAQSSAPAKAVSGVQITDGARQLASLERAIADVPAVSQQRVQKVAALLADGRYHVRAEKIADKMLHLDQLLADARGNGK